MIIQLEIFGNNKLLGIGNSQNVYGNPFNALKWILNNSTKPQLNLIMILLSVLVHALTQLKLLKILTILADFGEIGKINLFVE